MVNCPHCGKDFNPVSGQRYCPFCGEPLDVSSLREDRDPEDSHRRAWTDDRDGEPYPSDHVSYCPWEDQENLGFFKGITETLKQSLFSPQAFFSQCPRSGGLVVPLLYALIIKTTGSIVSSLLFLSSDNPLLGKLASSGNATLFVALMIPIAVFLSVIIEAAAVHLSLSLLGGAREKFEATFRVVCYGSGPELLDVIPILGGWAAIPWKAYLIIVGLREVHRISTGRAIWAVVLPSLICLGVVGMSVGLLAHSAGLS